MNNKRLAFIFLLGVGCAIFMQNPVVLLATCVIGLLISRRLLFTILFFIPVIKGAFDASSAATIPIPASLIVFGAISPILIVDNMFGGLRLKRIITQWYLFFFMLIILGYLVAIFNDHYFDEEGYISGTIKTFFSIIFSFLVAQKVHQTEIPKLKRGFILLLYLSIPIIFLIGIKFIFFSEEIDTVSAAYINFGYSKHGNFTAYIAMVSIFIYSFLNFNKFRVWGKIVAVLSLLVLAIIILKSGSRNGLVSFLFASFVFFLLYFKQNSFHKYARILFVIVISFGVLYSFQDAATVQRFTGTGASSSDINSLSSGRLGLWETGLNAFTEKPILGYGGTNSASKSITKSMTYFNEEKVMHNTPIEYLVRYGLIGFCLYSALVFIVIRRSLKLSRRLKTDSDSSQKLFMIPFLCFLSLTFSSFFLSWPLELGYWTCIGVVLGILSKVSYKYQRRPR